MKTLVGHLLGATRTAILAALLLRPEERTHVRELARLTRVSPGTLHRELTALAALGVLCREAVGRQVFFAANRDCPVFEELAGLLRKKRNLNDYSGDLIDPELVRECIAHAEALLARTRRWLAAHDADLLEDGE